MRVLLLTHYFWPEIGATQVIHAEWIKRFETKGHQVTVITGFPNYPDGAIKPGYRRRLFMREQRDGARIFRTATYAARNAGIVRRLLNHVSLTVSCWSAVPMLGTFDVVITEYPPLFTALSGLLLARMRDVPHVLNAGDLWVEAALELGALPEGPVGNAFLRLSQVIEKRSTVVVTAEGCVEKLSNYGISREQIAYIPNSVDTERFKFDAARRDEVRRSRGWGAEKIIVLYHGTHGISQGLTTLVDAAHLVRDVKEIEVVLMGDGADKPAVVARAKELGTDNVSFLDPEPFERMPGLIDACDIGAVPLRPLPLFHMTLPSKMFEFMAASRPFVLGVDGNARTIVEDAGAGAFYPPGDAAALAQVLRKLAADPELRQRMGERGRLCAVERYSRDRHADDLEAVLSGAIQRHSRRRLS